MNYPKNLALFFIYYARISNSNVSIDDSMVFNFGEYLRLYGGIELVSLFGTVTNNEYMISADIFEEAKPYIAYYNNQYNYENSFFEDPEITKILWESALDFYEWLYESLSAPTFYLPQ